MTKRINGIIDYISTTTIDFNLWLFRMISPPRDIQQNNLLKKIQTSCSLISPNSLITRETNFIRDLHFDIIDVVSLTTEISKSMGISIPSDEMLDIEKVSDLIQLIKKYEKTKTD